MEDVYHDILRRRQRKEDIQVVDPSAEGTYQLHYREDSFAEVHCVASRAYGQAVSTLSTLTALPPSPSEESSPYLSHNNNGFQLSSLFPSIQGHGPIASAMRIAVKLLHQSWLPASFTGYVKEELGGGRKKDVELHGKAVKVIDLLQHAADLGHNDALYTLAQVSLVRDLCLSFWWVLMHARSSRRTATSPQIRV